jgi:SAM-dependent methyltransferase
VTNYFDEPVAARYDQDTEEHFAPEHLERESEFLAGLAAPGNRALEFAIGTGRIAVPLARRGVEVAGIELSEPMARRLRAKPEGAAMDVVIGDMTTGRVDGSFDLVYLVFNTINNVTTQEGQVAVFANAARHLRPGGRFVIEVGVPDFPDVSRGQRFTVFDHGEQHVGIDEWDALTQQFWSHHYQRDPDGRYRRTSAPFRYAWPAELDLMARMAGLQLVERWADWDRSEFTASSRRHVSVWQTAS